MLFRKNTLEAGIFAKVKQTLRFAKLHHLPAFLRNSVKRKLLIRFSSGRSCVSIAHVCNFKVIRVVPQPVVFKFRKFCSCLFVTMNLFCMGRISDLTCVKLIIQSWNCTWITKLVSLNNNFNLYLCYSEYYIICRIYRIYRN